MKGVESAAKKRVAVFGAGIAGLTVAHELSRRGYAVCVYEANVEAGEFFRSAARPPMEIHLLSTPGTGWGLPMTSGQRLAASTDDRLHCAPPTPLKGGGGFCSLLLKPTVFCAASRFEPGGQDF